MADKEKLDEVIENIVRDYNAICARQLMEHRIKYNPLNESLVLANREQLSYGSFQCELVRGAEQVKNFVEASIKVLCFEYGE